MRKCAEEFVQTKKNREQIKRLIKQRIGQLKGEEISTEEYGKVIRMCQKEFENQIKNFNQSSIVLRSINSIINEAKCVIDEIDNVIAIYNDAAVKFRDYDGLKKSYDMIKAECDTADDLEAEIIEIKKHKDQEIDRVIHEKLSQQGLEDINQRYQNQKQYESLNMLIMNRENDIVGINNEISDIMEKLKLIEKSENESLDRFQDESTNIENQIIESRRVIDKINEIDVSHQLFDLRVEKNKKKMELCDLDNKLCSLVLEHKQLESQFSSNNGDEIESLKNRLIEIERTLESLPSLDEWNMVSEEISFRKSMSLSQNQKFSKEMELLKSLQNNANEDIKNMNIVIQHLQDEIIELKNEYTGLNLLKNQIELKQPGVIEGMLENQKINNQREQDKLDNKLNSIRTELNSVESSNRSNTISQSVSGNIFRNEKLKDMSELEKFFIIGLSVCIKNTEYRKYLIWYVTVLLIIFAILLIK